MPVSPASNRFADPWPAITGGIAGIMLLLLLGSSFAGKLVTRTALSVAPEDTAALPPVPLQKTAIGALRIEAEANIPANRWLTFELQVLDRQGTLLASVVKQAWHESGTWSEEGETGVWQESDTLGGLDIRTSQSEPLTVAVHVLEYTDTAGIEIDEPVSVVVSVRNGVLDSRYFWAGLIGSSLLAVCSVLAVPMSGKKVIDKSMPDSDIGDRVVLGGAGQLLRMTLKIESDETSPPVLQAQVYIKDSQGEQIYAQAHAVKLNLKREEGKVESATGQLTLFFLLEPRRSYGFYVEVTPDGPVDKTYLRVLEGAKTLQPVPLIHLKTT